MKKSIRIIRHDLAWAGFILLAAAAFGFWQQWRLVSLSWTGGLPAYLEAQREQRRAKEFQGVPTLSLPQAYEMFQHGRARFIDARSSEEYVELHISGAVNLNRERLEKEGDAALAGIPQDRPVVVYCGQESCDAALQVAEQLQARGYTRVAAFLGGFRAWDEAGYPVDTNK